MSWKESRQERKLMELERQRRMLMSEMEERPKRETRRDTGYKAGRAMLFKDEKQKQDGVRQMEVSRSGELEKLAEEMFLDLLSGMEPVEICFVLALMMKMLCLSMDE